MTREIKPIVSTSTTLHDIARRVGISKVAVSVVLNGASSNTRVSPETRQRILDAAADMNYHPNAAAQNLRRGRTDILGIVFGSSETTDQSMSSALTANIIQGAAVAAESERFNLMLFINPWREGNRGLNCLRDQRTDGAIFAMPLTGTGMMETLLSLGQPLVFIGYPAEIHGIPSVDVDNVRGGYDAAKHLLELGHRRIAHLQGDTFYACTAQRCEGFLKAMQEAGIATLPEYLIEGSYDGVKTPEDLRRLTALPNPPTALFAGNDIIAGQAVKTAREMGLSVPQSLSIVGFDDLFLPPHMDELVTTIRQPFFQMGHTAALLLIRLLRGEEVPASTVILPHELVIRNTTAPPR